MQASVSILCVPLSHIFTRHVHVHAHSLSDSQHSGSIAVIQPWPEGGFIARLKRRRRPNEACPSVGVMQTRQSARAVYQTSKPRERKIELYSKPSQCPLTVLRPRLEAARDQVHVGVQRPCIWPQAGLAAVPRPARHMRAWMARSSSEFGRIDPSAGGKPGRSVQCENKESHLAVVAESRDLC